MDGSHILAFNLALAAALVSPGPALIYALRASLRGGPAAGALAGCGLGLTAALWTLAALLGLDAVFTLFPWSYTAFKTGGALYLLYVAWGVWRGAADPAAAADTAGPRRRRARIWARAFGGGFLINFSNPKSVLFAAAVIVVVFPPGLGGFEQALIFFNHFALETVFYGLLAALLSRESVNRRYLRAKPVMDRIAAVLLGGLGVRLLAQD